jgi:oxygen-dependent protoporphyrinogen oxidase
MNTGFVVIGGGIAGLTAAYDLHRAGREVVLLEGSSRTGGVIYSKRVDGFELDLGPNSLLVTPALQERITSLGLDVIEAAPVSKNRYLVKDRTLHALSPHPLKLMQSPYLSWAAKGRLLTERFVGAKAEGEESVGAFFSRRFGKEITEAAVDPIFSGIYAGDIHRLSLDQILPAAARWEREYGSVTKGLLKEKGALKGGRRIINFRGGLQSLTDALALSLGERVRTNAWVTEVRPVGGRFRVTHTEGVIEADRVLYTANPSGFDGVPPIAYASVRTLHVAVPREALDIPPGFGFLVPSRENLALMGCIFTSAIFPSKAPEGQALLTVMMGGAHRARELRDRPGELETAALADLKDVLHIDGDLRILHSHTWTAAIPQKNLGYSRVLGALEAYEEAHPGFRFAGNAVSGVSVGDTMEYASKVVHSMT